MAEDVRVALAALAVTGIVGVAGPLITWQATRDVGELSARAELVRGDREDLRRVLDTATTRLLAAQGPYAGIGLRWERATRPLPERAYAAYRRRVEDAVESATQLQIRLGTRSAAFKPYADAVLQLQRRLIHLRDRPSPRLVALETRNSLKFEQDVGEFRAQAHRVAASELE
jgi:hypothetical protein